MSLLSLADAALSSALPSGSGGSLGALLGSIVYTQDTRLLSIQTTLPNGFVAERFSGRECVNELYTFDVDVLSVSASLDVRPLLGQPASLSVMLADGSRRGWTGYVTQACTLGADGGFARYRLRLQPWVAFLESHRDCRIFQDQTVQGILAQVFADYPQAQFQWNVTQRLRSRPICTQFRESDLAFMHRLLADEGLSYRFEHAQGGAASGPPQAQHTLVIFDQDAPVPPQAEPSIRFHRAGVTEETDAIVSFRESRRAVPNAVTVAAWDSTQLVAIAGQAQGDSGGLPQAEVYSGHRSGLYPDAGYANQIAALRLAGLQLPGHLVSGSSSVRSLDAGKRFTLTDHFANDGDYIPLVIEHSGANNLGGDIKALLDMHDLEAGSYRNRFTGIPAATPIVPTYRDKPTATGSQLAQVVGVAGEAVTSHRDHMVRIQFPWQRGTQPLAGGLTDSGSSANPQGNAPGDETSGTWVRVAEYSAGANHGGSFTPRIGTEVWVTFLHNDIDQPVVTGSLYTGQDPPPFAAGVDSGANHPGTISGIHSQTLDGSDTSQWVHDDSPGQLRTRLATSHLQSELNLGYLIEQSGAARGGFRGEGFELATQGWSTVRTGQGLLVSTTARQGGVSTQHDANEAIGQLNAAQAAAKRLSDAASQRQALPLKANQQQQDFIKAVDPRQDGAYTASAVGGQATTKPTGDASSGGDPVENFSVPAILLETPSSLLAATPNSYAAFASQALHLTVQQDAHLASGATVSTVSNQATSLFTYDGGLQAVAANGPLSIQAQSDTLQILADQSVTVTSTTDTINILANTRIVLQAGQASVTLDGQNITFACPGNFTVKSGAHAFVGAQSDQAVLPVLPAATPPYDEQICFVNQQGQAIANVAYQLLLADGTTVGGVTDQDGKTERVLTANPTAIVSATLTAPQADACCKQADSNPPDKTSIPIQGVKTNSVNLGSSQAVVTLKGHDRPLTEGEIQIAKTVFGDGLDYSKVKVHKGSYFWFNLQSKRTGVTPNGHLYFREDDFVEDFTKESKSGLTVNNYTAWFMHEMTHAWQYQRGYNVIMHALTVTIRGRSAYDYTIKPDQVFHDYNMEQQGNLVSDYVATCVLKDYTAVIHGGYIGTPNQLRQVLAPLFKDPKDASNLPK